MISNLNKYTFVFIQHMPIIILAYVNYRRKYITVGDKFFK